MKNILFICSKNQWRSPTGEQIFKNHAELNVRSAGTSASARKAVNAKDIQWADTIFVMEEKHKSRLKAEFTRSLKYKNIQLVLRKATKGKNSGKEFWRCSTASMMLN